jgi:hypothetical protein
LLSKKGFSGEREREREKGVGFGPTAFTVVVVKEYQAIHHGEES